MPQLPWNLSKFRKSERRYIKMMMIFADFIQTNHNHQRYQRSISLFLVS